MISTSTSLAKRKKTDALILPFFAGKKPAFSTKGLSSLYNPVLDSGDFTGKKEEVVFHYTKSEKEARIVLVGLGAEKSLTKEILRRSYAKAISMLKGKAKSVSIAMPGADDMDVTEAVAEGALLANYVYDTNKTEKEKFLTTMHFIDPDKEALERTQKVCESVYLTRNLVFSNADDITPTFLGKTAQDLAKEFTSLKATVLGPKEIDKEKLTLLQAVSRGSFEEPALIVLEYKGNPKSKEITALVGKGVTYDTGGLNLKPTGGMETMRDDMSGAATVLGTIHALASLKLPVNAVAVIGSTENAIGPKSYKPGDVYPSHRGITVEISNTDAEGRLVLADALSYAQKEFSPQRIIDIATLTGGAVVALGEEVSALMCEDDEFAGQLIEAGEDTHERLCVLPLYEEYDAILKSKVADIKNSGQRKASPIQGGIFLKKFISKTKWAHIDIAGTAFPDSLKPYQPVQATGVGVRLLTTFFENLCE
ncbi:MAG: leucyl aminopeptidase [Simkaniaceae bacterium]|nr:leucyl aminopeptidase [Candidatus Sacchlamyda saccharinae]